MIPASPDPGVTGRWCIQQWAWKHHDRTVEEFVVAGSNTGSVCAVDKHCSSSTEVTDDLAQNAYLIW